jgi:Cof subfamily protein (haloacid dehalogenase superfamily)
MALERRIRLVATDLDGTLVKDGHTVPQRSAAAIREAKRRGVHIVLATGRMHHSPCEFAEQLGLGDEPVISYNGAMARMSCSGELILHDPVPADLAVEILQYCVENRANIHYYLDDVMYVTRMNHHAISYWRRTGSRPVPAGDLRRFRGQAPTKILIIDEPDRAKAFLDQGRELYGDRLYLTHSLPGYVEYLSKTANKGRALQAVAEHLGIPLAETMACGDMINDQTMLRTAGVGVAMAGAPESVRQAADFVTQPGDDGVAEAIERFVLDRQPE